MKGLKGQVSLFIIVGIVLLLVVGTLFFVLYSKPVYNIEDFNPEALTPIERFITECLYSTAQDGLLLLGMQGGYIYFDSPLAETRFRNPNHFISYLDGGVRVPLWDIQGQVAFPTIDSITTDIKRYVEEEVPSCIQTITNQPSIENIQFHSNPVALVEITQDDVVIFLDYDLSVTFENRVLSFERYATRLDVPLRHILETAQFLTNQHRQDLIISSLAMNLVALDPNIPLADLRFSCEPLIWSKRQVTQRLQDHLTYMLPRVRVEGTSYMPFSEPLAVYQRFEREWSSDRVAREGLPSNLPDDIYEYMQQFWQIPQYDFAGLSPHFVYNPSYGMNLEINPSSGDIIQSRPGRSGSPLLRFFCMNLYHFTYDITFPFEIRLFDEDSFSGAGYSFSFALPAKVSRNIPTPFSPTFATLDAVETDPFFCEETLLNPSTIVARDARTGEYMSGVSLRYDCVRYFCDLGETSSASNTGIPELVSHLPAGCFNGFFIAEKPGFLRQKVQLESSNFISLDLLPLKNFNFAVNNIETNIPLNPEIYSAVIFIESKNHDFDHFAVYPSIDTLEDTIQLLNIPEDYKIEIMVLGNDNFVGGYFGEISVSSAELEASSIYFYPIIRPDLVRNTNPETIRMLFEELENNDPPYREQRRPVFR